MYVNTLTYIVFRLLDGVSRKFAKKLKQLQEWICTVELK